MASYIPNEAEEAALNALWKNGEDFFIGLMSNTPAALAGLGEALTFADITQVTNVVPSSSGAPNGAAVGAEWRMDSIDFSVPTGGSSGNDATHPQIEFLAGTGGASASVSGYYIRNASNVLRAVNTNPEVESSGTLKPMAEGAIYRCNPSLGAE
ncbi:MAG: hypothetical protein QNK05_20990 [Myxococcota bacterium]|nr:hypothetical protein [Myxococcota bacterium]